MDIDDRLRQSAQAVRTRLSEEPALEPRLPKHSPRGLYAVVAVAVIVLVGAFVAGMLVLTRADSTGRHVRATDRGGDVSRGLPAGPGWFRLPKQATVFPGLAPVTALTSWRGNLYAAGGSFGEGSYAAEPVVWRSTDGVQWTKVWDSGTDILGSSSSQRFLPTASRLLLFDTHNDTGLMWVSADGTTWKARPQPWGESELDGAARRGDQIVAVVGGGNGRLAEVWTSSDDGVYWQQSQSDYGLAANITSVTAANGKFVLGGSTTRAAFGKPVIWISDDAEHWKQQTVSPEPGRITAITGGRGTLVAAITAGIGNRVSMWSSSGAEWNRASIAGAEPGAIGEMLTTPTGFAALGQGPTLLFSTNGAGWQPAVAAPSEVASIDAAATRGNGLLVFTSEDDGPQPWRVTFAISPTEQASVRPGATCTYPSTDVGPASDPKKGLFDFNRVPRWTGVVGINVSGFQGCIPSELIYPDLDGGRLQQKMVHQSGNPYPPKPVFFPNGALAGYFGQHFTSLAAALAEGSVPQGFIDSPPTIEEFPPTLPLLADPYAGSTAGPQSKRPTGSAKRKRAKYVDPSGPAVQTLTVMSLPTLKFDKQEYDLDTSGITRVDFAEGGGSHTLVIEGVKGFELRVPGGPKTAKVDLKPGTYTIYCSVPGHRAAGEEATVVVK